MIKVEKWNRKEKPDVFKLVKELEKEELHPYTFTSYPGEHYSNHSHEHDEIRIVITGKMKFGVDGKEVVLGPGDRLIVSKGTVHWAEVIGNKKAVMLSGSK